MAKKVTTTTTETDEQEEKAAESLPDEIVRALSELDGADDVKWNITRLGGANPGFCPPAMTTVELTLENIARRHGPGHYRIKGNRSNGTYFTSATVTIAEPNQPVSDVNSLLQAMQKKEGAGSTDLMGMMLAMMQSNTQIVTAALSKPTTSIPWAQIVTAAPLMLTAVKEFFKSNSDNDAMEKLLKQLTLVEKLRGDDKPTNWADIVRDALPGLQSMVGRSPQPSTIPTHAISKIAQPGASMQQSAIPNVSAEALNETPEAVMPPMEPMIAEFLRPRIVEWLNNAAANKDTELRAEVFLDDIAGMVPDNIIKDQLTTEDWFEKLCAIDSRVHQYPGWFTELRDAILSLLDDKEESSNESEITGSDTGTNRENA